jgi:hypothetical protein
MRKLNITYAVKRVNKSEVTRTPTFNFGDCYTSQLILHSLVVNTSLPFTFNSYVGKQKESRYGGRKVCFN